MEFDENQVRTYWYEKTATWQREQNGMKWNEMKTNGMTQKIQKRKSKNERARY